MSNSSNNFKEFGIRITKNQQYKELISDRIDVCKSCEYKSQNPLETIQCTLCGCGLNTKFFSFNKNQCPINKWKDVDDYHLGNHSSVKNLRFVSAQPATKYYAWQVEVMINNFIEMGVNPNFIDIVCATNNGIIPEEWNILATNYSFVRFFFYDDIRVNKNYTSSIRPNVLKQHWEANPDLINDTIFYHDCDIVFTKPISNWITLKMIQDDVWYGSDTRWYISHSYIKSKGDDVMQKMCEIMQINESVIELNELNSIGAQYIMKNVTYEFWDRVESDCESLFTQITELNNTKKVIDASYHKLQIWCADMWALLWGAWRMGIQTECHNNLKFCWATDDISQYYKSSIMHNAGVTNNYSGFFYKSDYINDYPYNKKIYSNPQSSSRMYLVWIQKTAQKSYLI